MFRAKCRRRKPSRAPPRLRRYAGAPSPGWRRRQPGSTYRLAHRPSPSRCSTAAVSGFARTAAEERAERILREHEATTAVPAEFFDELLAALDGPPLPNTALARAARRARDVVTRD